MATELLSYRLISMLQDYLLAQPDCDKGTELQCGSLQRTDRNDGREVQIFLESLAWDMSKMEPVIFNRFQDQLVNEGYLYQDGHIVPVTASKRLAYSKAIAVTLDAAYIHAQIERLEASVVKDPDLAIGTAKEFVETCFKTILQERAIVVSGKEDIFELSRMTSQSLQLLPKDVPASARGADSIKRVLSNLVMIVQGVTELRNLYGTGHGKEGRKSGLKQRLAQLVVGAAATLVTFLYQTHLETPCKPREENP